MIFFHLVLLANLVYASSWFSTEPEYAKWSNDELHAWLEQRDIKVPKSFDKPHLYGLVDANWHITPSPLAAYGAAGRQWSLDQFNKVQRAFQHVKDGTFDNWDESKLRVFLLEQGVVAPSGPREQLVLLAQNRYHAYTDAAALYSSLASASASSVYASATDTAHSASKCISSAAAQATYEVARAFDDTRDHVYSAWDDSHLRNWLEEHGVFEAKSASSRDELIKLAKEYYRKTAPNVWESWSDSYIREWLIAHNILKPTDPPSRPSLVGEMKKYYYNCADSVWSMWSDSELKAWLVYHSFLKSDAERHREELVRMLEEHYLSVSESVWGAWSDSDIRTWLSERGYLEHDTAKGRKELLDLMNSKYSDLSAKASPYLVWPDARLRAYLREKGVGENILPTNRFGLLQETRIRWVQTSTWAETMYGRLKEIVNSSVEAAEDKVARILEVLSGHSRTSEKADDVRGCGDRTTTTTTGWSSHKGEKTDDEL